MANVIRMPQLGQTMEEATIVSILTKEGSKVQKGDVLFEIETDKATLEMESSLSGYIKKILINVGDTLPVDAAVAIIGDKDEAIDSEFMDSQSEKKPEITTTPPEPTKSEINVPESAKVIRLPQLGQTMEEGTIVSILAKDGNTVSKGDVVLEVETDKATLEMESPFDGCIKKILVTTGDTLPINAPVAVVADKNDSIPQAFIDSLSSTPSAITAEPQQEQPKPKSASANSDKEIEQLDHEIKLGDRVPLTRIQKITGQRMTQSKQEIPCFYLSTVVDMTDLFEFRSKLNKTTECKVSFNDFTIKALALAIKQFPVMAGQLDDDKIKIADQISIGLAISVQDGLVAPICKNADQKTLVEIAKYNQDLITKAKSGKLTPDDFDGGSITLSNLGAFGIESFIPIVVPGQSSILGVGWIKDSLVPSDDNPMVRKLMKMTLSVDHKVANGAYAAQFLDHVRKLLESPKEL